MLARMKIHHKMIVSTLGILLVFTCSLVVLSLASMKSLGARQLYGKGLSLGSLAAETVKPAVQYNVAEDVEKVLQQIVRSDKDVSVASIVIQGPKGDFAVTSKSAAQGFERADLTVPVKSLAAQPPANSGAAAQLEGADLRYLAVKIDLTANDGLKSGYVLLGLNDTSIAQELKKSSLRAVGLGLLLMALGSICVFFVARGIAKPLGGAVAVADALAAGDLSINLAITSHDETGQLMRAMQNMVDSLREMIVQTVNVSEGVASAASQLQQTSDKIATGTIEVESQASTVATASEEMSHTTRDIAHNCQLAADSSRSTNEAAMNGSRVVQETITGMLAIAERVKETAGTIDSLGARSEQIGAIIGTIEDIADQTNLLALNAAIEAARAGEQGRGFAVVADEVRALAERTTKATKEIGDMIKAIQRETKQAVSTMNDGVRQVEQGAASSQKSGAALEEILNQIGEVTMQINQIATAAEQQTATTNEIVSNIHQISEVVHLTAQGAEETATAASLLGDQVGDLQRIVSRFKLA